MSRGRPRTYLGNANSVAERVRVYRTERGLEIDQFDYSEIERRRIPFAEIALVTLHARTGGGRAWLAAAVAALFAVLAAVSAAAPPALYTFAALAFLAGLLAGVGFVLPTWTVTVFGQRTLARLVFRLREARARAVYAEISRLASDAQERAGEAARAAEPLAPPLPAAFVPPPFLDDAAQPVPGEPD
jgi:hypothetical protein